MLCVISFLCACFMWNGERTHIFPLPSVEEIGSRVQRRLCSLVSITDRLTEWDFKVAALKWSDTRSDFRLDWPITAVANHGPEQDRIRARGTFVKTMTKVRGTRLTVKKLCSVQISLRIRMNAKRTIAIIALLAYSNSFAVHKGAGLSHTPRMTDLGHESGRRRCPPPHPHQFPRARCRDLGPRSSLS
jgi:hypothetical protein